MASLRAAYAVLLLGAGGKVDGGLGQGDAAFWHTDEVDGLLGGNGDSEGLGVGQADVLRREDDKTAGDEQRVLS